jgi:putative mRNA 3-end processing factor
VHWCTTQGLVARPLALVGYGDEDREEEDAVSFSGGEYGL